MMRNAVFFLVALLFAGQIFAETTPQPAEVTDAPKPVVDITGATLGMADPILVLRNDYGKFSESSLGKQFEGSILEGSANNDLLSKALMTYEMLLPIAAKKSEKVTIALGGDFESIGDLTEKRKYLTGQLIGTIEYAVDVRQIFDMMGLLPSIVPEINNYIEVKPTTVEGYTGFHIKDKIGRNIKSDFIISHDGKTILFGAPSLIKQQLAAPVSFPAVVQNAFKVTEGHAGALVFVFPEGFKQDLRENYLNESSLDAAIKDALGGGLALTLSWEDDPVSSTAYLMATLADEDTATLLNTQLITPWLLPTVQQFLPALIGEGYGFPATMRAIQDGAFVGIATNFTDNEVSDLAKLLKDYVLVQKDLLTVEDELVIELDEDDEKPQEGTQETKAAPEGEAAPAPAPATAPAPAPAPEVPQKAE